MTLKKRIAHLESNLKGQDTMRRPPPDIDGIIRKLKLDPDKVRATANENNQSIAEVIAGELGMSYKDFKKYVEMRAQGK